MKTRANRFEPTTPVLVQDDDSGEVLGRLLDLNQGGALVLGSRELGVAPTRSLRLVPHGAEATPIRVVASCRWCAQVEGVDRWEAGFEFTGTLGAEHARRLNALILEHCA